MWHSDGGRAGVFFSLQFPCYFGPKYVLSSISPDYRFGTIPPLSCFISPDFSDLFASYITTCKYTPVTVLFCPVSCCLLLGSIFNRFNRCCLSRLPLWAGGWESNACIFKLFNRYCLSWLPLWVGGWEYLVFVLLFNLAPCFYSVGGWESFVT